LRDAIRLLRTPADYATCTAGALGVAKINRPPHFTYISLVLSLAGVQFFRPVGPSYQMQLAGV